MLLRDFARANKRPRERVYLVPEVPPLALPGPAGGTARPPLCASASGGRGCSRGLCPAGSVSGACRDRRGVCAGSSPTHTQHAESSPRTAERDWPRGSAPSRSLFQLSSSRPGSLGVVCTFDMKFSVTRCQCLN